MERKLYDLKFRVGGPVPASQDVVILGIDDDSLKAVGRWPWSRDDMARLVSRVQEAGPRVIVLDLIFAEKQETATMRTLANLCQEIAKRGDSEDIVALLEKEQERLDVGRILAGIISKEPPTLL